MQLVFQNTENPSYTDTQELYELVESDYLQSPDTLIERGMFTITTWLSQIINFVFRDHHSRSLVYETILTPYRTASGMLRRFPSFENSEKLLDSLEAEENEKIHHMFWCEYIKPNILIQLIMLIIQFSNLKAQLFFSLLAPKTTRKFYGYLEHRAVEHYSSFLSKVESVGLKRDTLDASVPEFARKYWNLAAEAGLRDVLLVIRADKAYHSSRLLKE